MFFLELDRIQFIKVVKIQNVKQKRRKIE